MERGVTSVPQGFCDSAIAEFIAKSSKLHNFHKSSQIFIISADFPQILGLDATSSQRALSKKGCFSVWKMEWTALRSHHARFTRATLDKRTKSGTNPHYSFGLRDADRLSVRAGAADCSRSRDTVIPKSLSRKVRSLGRHICNASGQLRQDQVLSKWMGESWNLKNGSLNSRLNYIFQISNKI